MNSFRFFKLSWTKTVKARSNRLTFSSTNSSGGASIAHWNQAHIMRPNRNGVWELKTPDVRFFGWFACKDCFVAAEAASAEQVKAHSLYHGYSNQVVYQR